MDEVPKLFQFRYLKYNNKYFDKLKNQAFLDLIN